MVVIRLYRYDDFERTKKLERKYDKIVKQELKKAGISETSYGTRRQEAIEKRIALSMGLNDLGEDERGRVEIDRPSEKYPNHPFFRVGLFWYSYDFYGAGFYNTLKNLTGKWPSYIFEPPKEEMKPFRPNWKKAKRRLEETSSLLERRVRELEGAGSVLRFFCDYEGKLKIPFSEEDAALFYVRELKQTRRYRRIFEVKEDETAQFSNYLGLTLPCRPLEVCGVMHGMTEGIKEEKGRMVECKVPCIYVVCKDGKEIVQALEIVGETIDFVLSKKDREKYYLLWDTS